MSSKTEMVANLTLDIQSEPSVAWTVAFGLAPPREEPGARSSFSQRSSSPLSSFSNAMEAFSSVRKLIHGGVA